MGYLLPANAADQNLAHIEIQSRFPDSLKIISNQKVAYFEFCPDNTCDLLKAKKPVSTDVLLDIGYLYLYYFSDYTELQEWRKSKRATSIARGILRKPEYEKCCAAKDKEQARCLLRMVMTEFDIALYFVRYDEKGRHLQRMQLPKK